MARHLNFNLGSGTNSVNLGNARLTFIEYLFSVTALPPGVTMLLTIRVSNSMHFSWRKCEEINTKINGKKKTAGSN